MYMTDRHCKQASEKRKTEHNKSQNMQILNYPIRTVLPLKRYLKSVGA